MKRCLAFLLMGILAPNTVAEELPLLSLGETAEHTVKAGEVQRFVLDLDAGDIFNVIVWQRGTDLLVRLVDPLGERVEEVDRFHNAKDREDLYRIVEEGGRYTVEVAAVDPIVESTFRIRLDERKMAEEKDHTLLPHWRSYDEARGLQITRRSDPESLRRAVQLYTSTLGAWSEAGDDTTAASALDNLGFCHRLLGELATAVKRYDQALDHWRAAGEPIGEANTWINRSTAESRLDRHTSARTGFQHAVDLLRTVRQGSKGSVTPQTDYLLSRALDGLGTAQKHLGELDAAEGNLLQALSMRREPNYRGVLAFTLNNLAAVELRLGEVEAAFENLAEAGALAQTLGNDKVRAAVLSNLGVAHEWSGEPWEAIEHFRASLELNMELGDRRSQAEVWRNLGVAYSSIGEYEEAQRCYGMARKLNQQLGRTFAEANNLMNLGWVFALQGRLKQALDPLMRAEKLLLGSGEELAAPRPLLLATVREKLGRVHAELGEVTTAQRELEGAEHLARAANDLRRQGRIALGRGEIAERRGDVVRASSAFDAAERFAQQSGDLWTRADALAGHARVERRRGRLPLAQRLVGESLELVEQARTATGEPLWRASLVAARIGTYELAAAIAMDRHRLEPGAGHDRTAFAFHQRARARSLLDQVALEEGNNDTTKERERTLRHQINVVEWALEELADLGHSQSEAYRQRVRERECLLVEHAAARAQLVALSKSGDPLSAEPLNLQTLQRRVLDPGAALLVYALGEERSHVFAITASTFESHELPSRGTIEGLAAELRGLLVAPATRVRQSMTLADRQQLAVDLKRDVERYPALARRLGGILLGPLWDGRFELGGGIERLAVVADGGLAGVPFAALLAPGAEGPLVASHPVVQLPSASVLAAVREPHQNSRAGSTEKLTKAQPPKTLAIFADPVFAPRDERLQAGKPTRAAASTMQLESPLPESLVPPVPLTATTRGPLRRLPWTAREAEAILGLLPPRGLSEHLLLRQSFEASREAFLDLDLADVDILHVATHGFVHPRHAALSGLVFSRFDAAGQKRDAVVRLHDLWDLDLAVELVVLSACETGLGHESAGEGLLGLAHGFFQAGTPRVVASLWQVNDVATAELMKRFYQGMLHHGEPAAEALAAAQVSMWRDPLSKALRHPYYWAGFVFFGDWR